jgi:hypothetical protein
MSVSGLSLESMLTLVQAQDAQRRQQAQQAQQAAQQAQQGAQQAQQPTGQPSGGQVLSGAALDAVNARNDAAGQKWEEFRAEAGDAAPDAAAHAGAASTAAQEALYNADASTPAAAPAPAAAAETAPNSLQKLLAEKPALKTNQDLINHFYEGGKDWQGASAAARAHGVSLGKLVRDRRGDAAETARTARAPSTTAPATTAPATTAPATTAPATTAPTTTPEAKGPARSIKGFREVDEAKLRAQLPPQAQHLAKAFIDSGRRHNVDPVTLAAISKHETGNFTSSAFRNKNNAMGISNDRGPTQQPSHEASIERMARLLGSTTGGPYKNASTIGEVANIYAPIGARNDPGGLNNHWARGVSRFADDLASKVRPSATTAPSTTAPSTTAPSTTAPSTTAPSTTAPSTTAPSTTAPSSSTGTNGTATFDRVTNAGRRQQMVEGQITVNGRTYDFRSGGHGRGSLPAGTYTVTPHMNSRSDASMSVGGVGYSFALSDKFDSRVGDTRKLLRIHPDGRGPGTEGCIGIVGNAEVQLQFRADMLAEIRRNGGSFQLRVGG